MGHTLCSFGCALMSHFFLAALRTLLFSTFLTFEKLGAGVVPTWATILTGTMLQRLTPSPKSPDESFNIATVVAGTKLKLHWQYMLLTA